LRAACIRRFSFGSRCFVATDVASALTPLFIARVANVMQTILELHLPNYNSCGNRELT
jgi:hypothetical protein